MTLEEAFAYSVQYLEKNNIDEADFKALTLVCHLAKIRNGEFHFHKSEEKDFTELEKLLERLSNYEPLQYIIGSWDFYESEFNVGKGVLIPRPETEELVEKAVDVANVLDKPVIYDLCSGSGCIGISIAKKVPSATVYCIEKSIDAFKYLEQNAKGTHNVIIINDDINNDFDLPKADIIISNPPYINSADMKSLQKEVQMEPAMALDGGEDGLDFYRIINEKWAKYLKPTGVLMLEIGNDQGESIKSVLTNFNHINVAADMYGNDRMVIAK